MRNPPIFPSLRLLAGFCGAWLATAAFAENPDIVVNPPNLSWTTAFSGVWNDAAPVTTLFMADDLAHLNSEMVTQLAAGRRLEAFESWRIDGGGRRYAGLFRRGTGERVLITGLDWATFIGHRQQQFNLGRRLIDLEVQLVEGERRFSGLWAPGSGAELTIEHDAAGFEEQWQLYSASHHLVAFDTWWSETLGEIRAFGVFRSGPEPEGAELAVGRQWDDFSSLVQGHGMEGKRLVDFDAAGINFDGYHSARWVPAPPARDWLGVFYTASVLTLSDLLFKGGHEFSGVGLPSGFILPEPTAGRMDMLDLEATSFQLPGSIVHGRPLHDAGTPGPPRPDGGG